MVVIVVLCLVGLCVSVCIAVVGLLLLSSVCKPEFYWGLVVAVDYFACHDSLVRLFFMTKPWFYRLIV